MPPPTVSFRHTCGNTGVYFVLTFWNRSLCNAKVGCDGQGLLQRTLEEKRREIFRVLDSQAMFKLLRGSRSFSK